MSSSNMVAACKRLIGGGLFCLTAAGFMTGTVANGAPINYGDFMGNTVSYLQVREARELGWGYSLLCLAPLP
jgi:hypothetical protein